MEDNGIVVKIVAFNLPEQLLAGVPQSKAMAVTLYTMGLSLNSIAKLFQVSTPAVLRWVKIFAEKTYETPEPREAVVVELDEIWHYLHQKKTNYAYESLLSCYRSAH